VLAKEGIDDLFLMGTSTGCVHVASFANAFPHRVLGVMLNTPTAPYASVRNSNEISPVTALGKWLIGKKYIGDFLAGLLSSVPAELRLVGTPDVDAAMRKMKRSGGTHVEIMGDLLDDLNRATTHTYRAWTDSMHTIVDDTPFDLAHFGQLTQRGVQFWITTSSDDTTNPPSMQRWWRDGVPGSELLEFGAGWGHMHAFPPDNLDTIFAHVASVAPQ
jgi:pimeloyl-ACP methyl ester carboxylesterase